MAGSATPTSLPGSGGTGPTVATHVEDVTRQRRDAGLAVPGPDGGLAERRQFLRVWHRAARDAGWPMTNETGASR